MKTVIAEVVARTELHPADPEPEPARLHHVTLVPARGARVVAQAAARAAPRRTRGGGPSATKRGWAISR
jgi:hypothetical protein